MLDALPAGPAGGHPRRRRRLHPGPLRRRHPARLAADRARARRRADRDRARPAAAAATRPHPDPAGRRAAGARRSCATRAPTSSCSTPSTGPGCRPTLTTREFFADVARVLRPDGVLLANLADGPPLRYAAPACAATVREVLPSLVLIGDPAVLKGAALRQHRARRLARGPAGRRAAPRVGPARRSRAVVHRRGRWPGRSRSPTPIRCARPPRPRTPWRVARGRGGAERAARRARAPAARPGRVVRRGRRRLRPLPAELSRGADRRSGRAPRPARSSTSAAAPARRRRLLAAPGVAVLGVEPDPKMAAVARRHGLEVEVGAFEQWDDAGPHLRPDRQRAGLALGRPGRGRAQGGAAAARRAARSRCSGTSTRSTTQTQAVLRRRLRPLGARAARRRGRGRPGARPSTVRRRPAGRRGVRRRHHPDVRVAAAPRPSTTGSPGPGRTATTSLLGPDRLRDLQAELRRSLAARGERIEVARRHVRHPGAGHRLTGDGGRVAGCCAWSC